MFFYLSRVGVGLVLQVRLNFRFSLRCKRETKVRPQKLFIPVKTTKRYNHTLHRRSAEGFIGLNSAFNGGARSDYPRWCQAKNSRQASRYFQNKTEMTCHVVNTHKIQFQAIYNITPITAYCHTTFSFTLSLFILKTLTKMSCFSPCSYFR